MELFGARVIVAPPATVRALAFVAAGVGVGVVSGLLPGLHVNALAMVLAGAASVLPGPPHLVAAALLAAGVVHTFLDVVPTLALGVPDAAMAATALPGHRLVLEGRGREALRLSALGSAGAVVLAVPLGPPLTAFMARAYPVLEPHIPIVLAVVAATLVFTEPTRGARVGAAAAVVASGALGAVVLETPARGPLPVGSLLGPLFAGLFGAPVLVDAARGDGPPPQGDAAVEPDPQLPVAGATGSLAGAVVGFLPGVSSGIAATFALGALPRTASERAYIVATSGVNTANTILSIRPY